MATLDGGHGGAPTMWATASGLRPDGTVTVLTGACRVDGERKGSTSASAAMSSGGNSVTRQTPTAVTGTRWLERVDSGYVSAPLVGFSGFTMASRRRLGQHRVAPAHGGGKVGSGQQHEERVCTTRLTWGEGNDDG
jgi:hypothetical protein